MKNCENCSSLHNGEYGSGRFCSSKCARSFSSNINKAEKNIKISKALKGTGNKDVLKTCEHCDESFTVEWKRRNQRHCSKKCARQKYDNGDHPVVNYRRALKLKAIEYKGGLCVCCGYNRTPSAMVFHHLDPDAKEFGIGGKSISWDRLKVELDKTILVCNRCHTEIHEGLIPEYKMAM